MYISKFCLLQDNSQIFSNCRVQWTLVGSCTLILSNYRFLQIYRKWLKAIQSMETIVTKDVSSWNGYLKEVMFFLQISSAVNSTKVGFIILIEYQCNILLKMLLHLTRDQLMKPIFKVSLTLQVWKERKRRFNEWQIRQKNSDEVIYCLSLQAK